MVIIIDACALIAYLNGEEGCDVIGDLLLSSEETYIHAANWCEVCYDFLKRDSGDSKLQELRDALPELGIKIYRDMGDPLLKLVASLKATLYGKKRTVSFADCFALASTALLEGCLVTSDYEMGSFLEFCDVMFFRKPKKLWFEAHPFLRDAMNGIINEPDEEVDVKVMDRLFEETSLLIAVGILDLEKFSSEFKLVLKEAIEDGQSILYFLDHRKELDHLLDAKIVMRGLLAGVIAGSGFGPPQADTEH